MEQWIAETVGKMHVSKITQAQIADKLGVTKDYIWMILNGKKTPKDAEARITKAIDEIIAERQ